MKISDIQEKLQKAKLIGAHQVVLHEGKLDIDRFFGIKDVKIQNDAEAFLICGTREMYGTPIDELFSRLEEVRRTKGNIEVRGSLEFQNPSFQESHSIKTVCVIAYKNSENEDALVTLLSISDLS